MPADYTRATDLTPEVKEQILGLFEHRPWNACQVLAAGAVKTSLIEAAMQIVSNVPPSPDRTTALRKLHEAGMDCNVAITQYGKCS